MEHYHIAIIGAGPGGYVAAIHAAKSGLKVALIEKDKVGGACYNVGCIPSKIMLEHSKLVQEIRRGTDWGITVPTIDIDFPKLMQRKDAVVAELLDNIEGFIESAQITMYRGEASVTAERKVMVGEEALTADHVILATGSRPFVPPFKGIETANYYTTDTFFSIEKLPKQLTIIGGGVIAIEMAFALAPMGTKVTVLNHSQDILQTEEPDARPIIRQRMAQLGIELVTDFTFEEIRNDEIHTSKGVFTYENLLFATGRRPNTQIAEALELKMDGRLIAVNNHYETSIPSIFAIGDLVGGFQLAHSASAEGVHAVDYILGKHPRVINQQVIPRCVYTHPEIATFGMLEHEAPADAIVTKMYLPTNPKALLEGNIQGFMKFVASPEGDIYGACVVGDGATEMINAMLACKIAGGSVKDLARMVFPHPTVSEHIGDAARAVFGKAIHLKA
ncbi:dihydrolipoyl dehydrogenase [Metasolibacillus meyeri]|uniref:Dihydrolipoyl dehydrogenase n=1 Tax=Metasolibacillus meyeri TaxID=1071052 RepID=A0AAW9NWE5_9BACL|nr:dihydrolipoyl dehydrogenase [Metasolibacillus meyeri]MEC1179829.1 dihydrolipoyl dehydrogenase [Metasolibacillus meyeri]